MKDTLQAPFERPFTEKEKMVYNYIKAQLNNKIVIDMTYPSFFYVLDRIKLSYQLDMLERLGMITIDKDEAVKG